MADEQAVTEAPGIENPQEESTTPVDSGSEAAPTQSDDSGKGDLHEALRQERERYRQLEQATKDPNFIYQQARQLGLTEEEAQAQVDAQMPTAQPSGQDFQYSQYKYYQDLDKSKEKYPQLANDEEDQLAITALMRAKNLSPLAAADRYYGKMNKTVEAAKVEGAKAKETTISEKEMAQTVVSTQSTNSESAEYEDILRRSRDFNSPRAAEKAQLELIKWKEAHR